MTYSRLLLVALATIVYVANGNTASCQDISASELLPPTLHHSDDQPATLLQPASLRGSWGGSWISCTTNHKGPMSATFCQLDANRYQVHFRGRFFKLIPFQYTAVLNVVGYEGDRVLLSGSHRLGPIMGTFHYSAWASATQFVATYRSKNDSGQFVLSRH